MIGIVVILALSWLLLYRFDNKSGLRALGLQPTAKHLWLFAFGLLLTAASCVFYHLFLTVLHNNSWQLNTGYSWRALASGLWWNLKSALFEELLFRGVLLYFLLKWLGMHKACLVSALAFGVYHWFSYGAFGNVVLMVYLLLATGTFGWMLAYSFAKSKTLYFPIGLHLGWNIINILVFSKGPLGNQLLVTAAEASQRQLSPAESIICFVIQTFIAPCLVILFLRRKNAMA